MGRAVASHRRFLPPLTLRHFIAGTRTSATEYRLGHRQREIILAGNHLGSELYGAGWTACWPASGHR